MRKRTIIVVSVILATLMFVAMPVLAYLFRAPYTVTESDGNAYDMVGVVTDNATKNLWMSQNGFMLPSGNDTHIETLGGLEQPHMVTDNATLTAVAVPANSQTNLYFTTGNSESAFDIIPSYDGYITVPDNADLELADNFTIEQKGWIDTSQVGANLTSKVDAFRTFISASENISSGIANNITQDAKNAQTELYWAGNMRAGQRIDDFVGWIMRADFSLYEEGSAPGSLNATVRAVSDNSSLGVLGTMTAADVAASSTVYSFTNAVYVPTTQDIRINIEYEVPGSDSNNNIHVDYQTSNLCEGYHTIYSLGAGYTDYLTFDETIRVYWLGPIITATGVSSGEHTVSANYTPNLLTNSSFETGDPPDDWTIAGAGASRARSTEHVQFGSYSVNVTRNGNNATLYFDIPNYNDYAGETVSIGCWVYATQANTSRVGVNDGTGSQYSGYHSGDSTMYWLSTGSYEVDESPTSLRPLLVVDTTNTTSWFDGAILIVGDSISDYNTFRLFIDDVEQDQTYTETAVPDNSENWTFMQGNSMPYAEYITLTTGQTQQLWFQPNSMIIGGNLPNRSIASVNGTFNWGSNPVGVNVTMGGMVSESQPAPGITVSDPTIDILPEVRPSDWFVEPDVGGELQTNPLRPFVTLMSNTTTITELQAWRFLALAFVLLVTVATARAVRGHHLITGLVAGGAIYLAVDWTIWPMWALVFVALAIVGGLVAERTSSL